MLFCSVAELLRLKVAFIELFVCWCVETFLFEVWTARDLIQSSSVCYDSAFILHFILCIRLLVVGWFCKCFALKLKFSLVKCLFFILCSSVGYRCYCYLLLLLLLLLLILFFSLLPSNNSIFFRYFICVWGRECVCVCRASSLPIKLDSICLPAFPSMYLHLFVFHHHSLFHFLSECDEMKQMLS